MKTHIITLILIFFVREAFSQNSLSGKITDKESGETLAGAVIYFPDLKISAMSDADGNYKADHLPKRKTLVQVSLLGYKNIIETVDLLQITAKDFSLETSVKEINEIVVTGTSQAGEKNRTPTPITVVSKERLLQNASSNIIDAIAAQPGVSQVTTGTGISKPVIRGLGYNRVVVVNDGVRQEGQQWGDEHGIEIDEFSVDKIEVLKGPASMMYGSDAMAGVIHMISAPSNPEGTIKGNILGNYLANNGQIGYSGNISGNSKGTVWDVRYSGKQARSYKNKYDGYVQGSGFKENSIGGIIGINRNWGYSHLHLSAYHLIPGIPEGERDSATGKFIKKFVLNDSTIIDTVVSDAELKSYSIEIPHQDIAHYKAVLNSSFTAGKGYLKTIFGIQKNHRKEFDNIVFPDQYGLYFLLNSINYDVRYIFPEKNKFSVSTGVNGMHQSSQNKGEEFLVPQYRFLDIGGFVTAKKSFNKLDISGGLRYDIRGISSDELLLDTLGKPTTANNLYHVNKFREFKNSFSNVSGSIGFTYQLSKQMLAKANVSKGFRAPNIAELGANGEHEGTSRYEIGNPLLKAENSLQLDYAMGFRSHHISAEADLFYNNISHFIYAIKLTGIAGGDSIINPASPIPAFKFTQGNAVLAGGEILVDIHPHPLDWLHFENSFSYVLAIQKNATDSTKYLPFIPAPKVSSELQANIKKAGKMMRNTYIKLGLDNYFMQNKIYSAYATETKTPGYTLVNTGVGTDFVNKNETLCSIYMSINNLTDVSYQNHLSRLKYSAGNHVTGRTGVYNMGRNITFKILIPLSVKN